MDYNDIFFFIVSIGYGQYQLNCNEICEININGKNGINV